MTSEAFVWRWHPDACDPVLCGRLYVEGGVIRFVYRRAYRESYNALPISPYMPLDGGELIMRTADTLPRPLADAAPDAWGRRVIEYRSGKAVLDELGYLLHGHGNRIGAIEFTSGMEPPKSEETPSSLEQLLLASESLETNQPLSQEVLDALEHGTSIGGARPKATLRDGKRFLIAKFTSTTDDWPVTRCEYAAMQLAKQCGIDVPWIDITKINGKDVMLLERFDRELTQEGTQRRQLLSALGLLNLDELEHEASSYPKLAEMLRKYGYIADAQSLFRRLIFNILIGNTDDHAKNHSVFWDGRLAKLTPAYDIVPQRRIGQEANQAMRVGEYGKSSTLKNAMSGVIEFGLTREQGINMIDELIEMIHQNWKDTFHASGVPERMIEHYEQTSMLSPAVMRRE